MIAGLQSDVGGGAAETNFVVVLYGVFESCDFCMVEDVVFVPALAQEFAVLVDNDAANGGVGGRQADAATGEVESALHPVGVLSGGGHGDL